MQAVLCLVFAGSIGLAALVSREYRGKPTGIQHLGPVGVEVPEGWILQPVNRGPVLCVALEPDSADKKGRRLTIELRKVDPDLPPGEFLQSSGLLRGTFRQAPPADPTANIAESITIAGLPGIMLRVLDPTEQETELFAASVRPSGLAISLRLECPDDSDPPGDVQTLRQIAAAMTVRDSVPGQ
jgi:hypothetical protein